MSAMRVYRAPAYEENKIMKRDFMYWAEVDIMGWKFRRMNDGALEVEAPGPNGSIWARFSPDHRDVLATLLGASTPPPGEALGLADEGRLA